MRAKFLLPSGWLVASMGAGMLIPLVQADLQSTAARAIAAAALTLLLSGVIGIIFGRRQEDRPKLPVGVRLALMANVVVLAFFTLEFSDRIVNRNGQIFYWSTFLFPPALILYAGLLTAQSWGWIIARGVAGLGTLWFLAFVVIIPTADLRTNGVVVPWYGRLYMICFSLAFAAILAGAFRSLGRPDTRTYFSRLT